jgi:Tfp pilus assembly protein PilP
VKNIFFISLLLVSFSVGAQKKNLSAEKVNEFFKGKTKIENPYELRDPFKAPPTRALKSQQETKSNYFKTADGTFTNIPDKGQVDLQDIRIVGVLIGKERRALAKFKDGKEVVILREGMKVGQDNAELKAILPGGIVLVEKIINVYGQEEYLETVIPISK